MSSSRRPHLFIGLVLSAAMLLGTEGVFAASVRADFDGDGKTDLTVYRPSTGEWYVRQSSTGFATFSITQWGLPGDVAVAGDYDGDGRADYAVYRRIIPWRLPEPVNEWYVLLSSSGYTTFSHTYFGLALDIPVPADYDGDGKTDVAVFRPSNGTWHVQRSSVAGPSAYVVYPNVIGAPFSSDYPVPADYDGDGIADPAVYRRSGATASAAASWYGRLSSVGFATKPLGLGAGFGSGDRPVPGDYDGDGKADIGVYRPSDGTWRIWPNGSLEVLPWGIEGDIPEPGDYDGDGKLDIAVHRPSNGFWFIRNSGVAYQWALPDDIPVPHNIQLNAVLRVHAFTDSIRASDFDGDGTADLTVFRPSDGTWHTLKSSTGFTTSATVTWGAAGDIPVPGDFDGDGFTDVVVWRPSEGSWYFKTPPRISYYASDAQNPWPFGLDGDIPLSNNFEGNGVTNMAFWRPSGSLNPAVVVKYLSAYVESSTRPVFCAAYTCAPIPGSRFVPTDYDGDGRSDAALYLPFIDGGNWKIGSSVAQSEITKLLGVPSDIPVPADYDGDGAADIAVFRPSTGTWLVKLSNFGGAPTYNWGVDGDIPVPGDYDGDGIADIAVYHPSTGVWSILKSSTNFTRGVSYQWGQPGDIPILGRQ
jgi:hypothetical protein